jgi:hypothetical protein
MNHHVLVIDATSLADAEIYGEFLTHPRGHYEVWESRKTLSPAGLASAGLPAPISWHEYEDFPRGRIVCHRVTQRFTIYTDQRLQNAAFIRQIAEAFELPVASFDVRSDQHYRTKQAD